MSGQVWRTMDSAPKDGTPILVYDEDEGIMLVVWTKYREFYPGEPWVSAWCVPGSEQDEQGGYYEATKPLRWMPLPEPPRWVRKDVNHDHREDEK